MRRLGISDYAERTVRSALVSTAHLARSNVDAASSCAGSGGRDESGGDGSSGAGGAARAASSEAGDGGMQGDMAGERAGAARRREPVGRPRMVRDGGPMARTREHLPVFAHRRQLLEALSHPISIV